MARIESHAVSAERKWVAPSEVIEAAAQQVEARAIGHRLDVDSGHESLLVRLDPRLTSRRSRTSSRTPRNIRRPVPPFR